MAESRVEKMVSELKACGSNCGLIVQDGSVVSLVLPTFVRTPTPYSLADLDEGVKLDRLKKTTWYVQSSGAPKSWSFEMYTVS